MCSWEIPWTEKEQDICKMGTALIWAYNISCSIIVNTVDDADSDEYLCGETPQSITVSCQQGFV